MNLIELGGGTNRHRAAKVSLDTNHPVGAPACNVGTDSWPVESGSADVVYSSHLLEHIPKGDQTINVFNEALRVLRPGGRFISAFPCIGWSPNDPSVSPKMVVGWQPYADPTHVQGWWMPESVQYLTGEIGAHASYGIDPGWRPMGPELDADTAEPEIVRAKQTGMSHNLDTWWHIANKWEAWFALVKS